MCPPQNASELEYGLIVLWEMLEHQAPLLEGREADIFSLLLKVRSSGHAAVRFALCSAAAARGSSFLMVAL